MKLLSRLLLALMTVFFFSEASIAEEPEAAAQRLGLVCTGQGIYGKEHARWHKKYRKMHNQGGKHCCNEGDCRPSIAVYDKQSSRWLTCVNEKPRFVKAKHHVKDAYGLTGFASVCVNSGNETLFYCFVPPYDGG